MKVPFLDLKPQYQAHKAEIDGAVLSVMAGGAYILGPQVKEFEAAAASHCGVKHAVSCANGSDALRLCLMALGVGPGDEVIVPSFTFFATAGAVSIVGATPVFCDISPGTFNMDPSRADELVTDRTKALIAVHLFGQMADMDAITALCRARGIHLIEDAAQAIGASYSGRTPGSFGAAATLSFFPTKNLGAAGDAGMVLTNDDSMADRIAMLRVHGSKQRYYHQEIGFNSRMDALQAAVLGVKIKYLNGWTRRRGDIAARYDALLRPLEKKGSLRRPVRDPKATTHVFNQYTVLAERRDELRAQMTARGIGTEIYYPVPLHRQECYRTGARSGPCPVSEASAAKALALPMFPELNDDQVALVADAIREFYG